VHPILFRVICSFLDQGIAIWNFPVRDKTFLSSIRELERNSAASFFRERRARDLLLKTRCEIADLLAILVGDESLYKQYLFDQQFAHQGWSGIVSAIENEPQTLLQQKKLSMHDLIVFELLLEIDALDYHFGGEWPPLVTRLKDKPIDLFADIPETELNEVLTIWQEAFEWTYYDEVLADLRAKLGLGKTAKIPFVKYHKYRKSFSEPSSSKNEIAVIVAEGDAQPVAIREIPLVRS